jgi:hypothetical protein
MKALTVWQPWASLLIVGAKGYEFRPWRLPEAMVGERSVIHAGKRPTHLDECRDIVGVIDAARHEGMGITNPAAAKLLLTQTLRRHPDLPVAAGIGTVRWGEPVRCTELYRGAIDADDIDPRMWAWPVFDPEPWPVPVPCRGARQFWAWPA